jgi:uncharacterized membrane protein YgcG
MKNSFLAIAIVLTSLFSMPVFSQTDNEPEALGLPGDNLDLYAVLDLFQKSKTIEDFEKSLNLENTKINNLDLDNDKKVDFIKVITKKDGDNFTFILQVAVSKKETQDVAVILVSKDKSGKVSMQIVGDKDLYGKNYIVEPKAAGTGAVTANPGYTGAEPVTMDIPASTTTVVVQSAPIVQYVYSPVYVPYYPPYYYGYYPPYFAAFTVMAVGIYRHNNYYYHGGGYGYHNTTVVVNHNNYNNYNNSYRNSSNTVAHNNANGNYKNNGTRPSNTNGNRPSTGTTGSGNRPSTGNGNGASTRPTTRPTSPSTRPTTSPSTRPTSPSTSPSTRQSGGSNSNSRPSTSNNSFNGGSNRSSGGGSSFNGGGRSGGYSGGGGRSGGGMRGGGGRR